MQPKKTYEEIGWHVQSALNFIAQGLHLKHKLFEKNKPRKLKFEWKINKIKMTFN